MCAQSCPTLWGPVDCSLLGSSVHGIFQVRILEWVGISSFRGSSQPRDQTCGSCVSCTGRQILLTRCHLGSPMTWNALCLFVSKDCFRHFIFQEAFLESLSWAGKVPRYLSLSQHSDTYAIMAVLIEPQRCFIHSLSN